MAVVPPLTLSVLVSCSACPWAGNVGESRLEPDDLARCPECWAAVVVDEMTVVTGTEGA